MEVERARGQSARAIGRGRRAGTAKSCIYIFLWGGPPQQDMWDMKPDAPEGIRSQFRPIATNIPGIQICDQLPRVARHADKFAIVRSLSHSSNVHESSCYHMLTGQVNPTLVVPRNHRRRSDFPNVGSIVSFFSEPGTLPAAVTIPRPIGHDGITYSGTYAGFLGPGHDPMELREAPNSNEKPAPGVTLPDGIDATRLLARRGLLSLIESQDRWLQSGGSTIALDGARQRAFTMLAAPQAKRAFDLDHEPSRVRDRFGRNEWGESFLLARRLVEAGVRLVSVIWMYFMPNGRVANVWDNHGGTEGLGGITGYAMLKQPYCLPSLDQAYSALLEDLAARGLLDETLVVIVGEFGRTPKINATAGRDHWGMCQSVVLAGGGVRPAQVYGSSDKIAAYPKDQLVSPEDLLATIYFAMGLAPDELIADREGRTFRISDGRPITALFG
jgi:hypothetical protein